MKVRLLMPLACILVADQRVSAQPAPATLQAPALQVPASPGPGTSGATLEKYREGLESFRIRLEETRQKQDIVLTDYRTELQRYREGIDDYRTLSRDLQQDDAGAGQRRVELMQRELQSDAALLRTRLADEVALVRGASDAATLERGLEQSQRQILDRLSEPELAGMRAYVRDRLPDPQRAWQQGGDSPQGREQYALRIESLLNLLGTTAKDPVVRIVFSSAPSDARVELSAKYASQGRAEQTEATFQNVYRGVYVYEVRLNGFKTARDEMDLIANGSGRMVCKLVPAAAAADSTCSRQ